MKPFQSVEHAPDLVFDLILLEVAPVGYDDEGIGVRVQACYGSERHMYSSHRARGHGTPSDDMTVCAGD